ncbi:MAG: hypothetical protein ACD_58C00235G0002 [uncultured bacterium]|nr:MAG: hypothetical protein ACD_58C00235G0002 [uncultured bacterium]
MDWILNTFNIATIFWAVISYLIGAIPFGYLVSRKVKGIDPATGEPFDIRNYGSGSTGYANCKRKLGSKPALAILIADITKGVVITLIVFLNLFTPLQVALVGLLAIIGHCYPIYLGFHGGKGVATACGVLIVINFWAAILGFAAWKGLSKKLNISSVGSLFGISVACLVTILRYLLFKPYPVEYLALVVIITLFIFYKHKENIRRFISGEENTLSI